MPAAGSGRRFGDALPKQYVSLAGRTLIEWALAPFLRDERCAGIVVAIAADDRHWAGVHARLNANRPNVPQDSARPALSTDANLGMPQRSVAPAPGSHANVGVPQQSAAPAQSSGADVAPPPQPSAAPANAAGGVPPIIVAQGGAERSHTVLSALRSIASQAAPDDWVLVHDAARPCLPARDLEALLARLAADPVGGLLAARAADTLKRATDNGGVEHTVDRSGLWRALTPQMFRYQALGTALDQALAAGRVPTDEAQAIEWMGQQPVLVEGSAENIKVTHTQDLIVADALLRRGMSTVRVGSGIDVHAFGPGEYVTLAGVRVPYGKGVVAHSDGDVILHALCDALLGAAGLGDIGMHFRDDDPQWKGADSKKFVTAVIGMLKERNLRVVNADITVLAEAPRLGRHRAAMRQTIAELLEVDDSRVNVKATTTERLGFIGRSEGLAAQAIVALTSLSTEP